MNIYKNLLRPLLFRVDAENAHNLGMTFLRTPLPSLLWGSRSLVKDERLRVSLGGLKVPNPVGIAAGFDKDCDAFRSLCRMGFGYVVCGSVMLHRRPGNPRPRMVREPRQEALWSCMGLPSKGLEHAARSLRRKGRLSVPLTVNINAETYDDYLKTFDTLQPLADAMEVTLFCPNRPADAGDFLQPEVADPFLAEIVRRKEKPLFIKIPGYVREDERARRLQLVRSILKHPVDGITITPESRMQEKRLSMGAGTLTGRPMLPQLLGVIRDVYALTGNGCAIKGAGGISTARDAFEAIAAGASSVEILTGFIYEGWAVAKTINLGLLKMMDAQGIQNVDELRGLV
jgi:dihydroorotate dehydrogenase